MNPVAAIDPTTATFILAILVLVAGMILALAALKSTNNTAQQAFAAVGVLFGLLAAGGLGGLFANQVAQDAASATVTQTESATEEVGEQVEELSEKVEESLEPGSEGSGAGGEAQGKAGEGK
jgi:hypothetical protein